MKPSLLNFIKRIKLQAAEILMRKLSWGRQKLTISDDGWSFGGVSSGFGDDEAENPNDWFVYKDGRRHLLKELGLYWAINLRIQFLCATARLVTKYVFFFWVNVFNIMASIFELYIRDLFGWTFLFKCSRRCKVIEKCKRVT